MGLAIYMLKLIQARNWDILTNVTLDPRSPCMAGAPRPFQITVEDVQTEASPCMDSSQIFWPCLTRKAPARTYTLHSPGMRCGAS